MRRIPIILVILSALTVASAADERYIVRVSDGDEAPKELFQRLGFKVEKLVRTDEELFCVVSSDALPEKVVEALFRSEKAVRAVEPIRRMDMAETEQGEAREKSYSTARRHRIGAELQNLLVSYLRSSDKSPWSIAYARQGVLWGVGLGRIHRRYGEGKGVVAFIDTGVDPNHPQLSKHLVPGYDFVRDRPGIPSEWDDLDAETAATLHDSTTALVQQSTVAVLDGWNPAIVNQSTVAVLDQKAIDSLSDPRYQAFGHGTMVAGLVHLVAPEARLMPLKAFRSDGTGDTASIAAAIYFAVDNGASVINMSFSFDHFSMEVMRALNYATRRGVVTIAAAGNRGESLLVFPAALANVPGVAGLALDGSRSEISNFGEDLVSVAAPGEQLVSTYPGAHYAMGFGTSFSAALVSGAASLMIGIVDDLRPADFERALAVGRDSRGELGYGRLNLERSLEWVRKRAKE